MSRYRKSYRVGTSVKAQSGCVQLVTPPVQAVLIPQLSGSTSGRSLTQ